MKRGKMTVLAAVTFGLLGRGSGVPEAHAQSELVWSRRFPTNPPPLNYSDYSVGVKYAAGHAWVGGLKSGNGTSLFQAIKYDPTDPAGTGIVAMATWPAYATRQTWTARAMTVGQTTAGPVLVIAGTVIKPGSPPTQDIQVVAFGQDLGLLWNATYNNTTLVGNDISVGVAADGLHAVVVGNSAGVGTGSDIVTLVYNVLSGSPIGVPQRYNSGAEDTAAGVALDQDNTRRVYVGGTSPPSPGTSGVMYRAIGYDIDDDAETVTPIWVSQYATFNRDNIAAAVAANPKSNAFYITGQTALISSFSNSTDYLTVRFNKNDGAVEWAVTYDGPVGGHDAATAIATQAISGPHGTPGEHYVYVTGRSAGAGTLSDMTTIRYSDLTGPGGVPYVNQDWFGRWHRVVTPGFDDEGVALVSHAETPVEVFVTGASKSSGGDWDYVTAHYDTDPPPDPTTTSKDPVWDRISGLAGAGAHDIPAGIA